MSIFAWIIVGLIAGFLARLVLPGEEPGPRGVFGDLLAGIVGALVGGWIFRAIGMAGVTGINLGSILVAFVGAVIFLLIWRAITKARHHGVRQA
ncbi:MAG: GlsB/YeaQ/YmgE family stress response membrane protein [Armatimonadota bacterium]